MAGSGGLVLLGEAGNSKAGLGVNRAMQMHYMMSYSAEDVTLSTCAQDATFGAATALRPLQHQT